MSRASWCFVAALSSAGSGLIGLSVFSIPVFAKSL